MSKFYLEHPDQLDQIGTRVRNGGWLLRGGHDIQIVGDVTVDVPLKFYGSSSISGDIGSRLNFVDKGCITAGEATRSLTLNSLNLSTSTEKGLFAISPNTARSVKMHNVVVDAMRLGCCNVPNLIISQTSFLNEEMEPLAMGQFLDTLIMSNIRHDGKDVVIDLSRTAFDGIGLISEILVLQPNSGLILLNDYKRPDATERFTIAPNTFILKNIQGLNRDIDIFRNRDTAGNLRTLDSHLIQPYVI